MSEKVLSTDERAIARYALASANGAVQLEPYADGNWVSYDSIRPLLEAARALRTADTGEWLKPNGDRRAFLNALEQIYRAAGLIKGST